MPLEQQPAFLNLRQKDRRGQDCHRTWQRKPCRTRSLGPGHAAEILHSELLAESDKPMNSHDIHDRPASL